MQSPPNYINRAGVALSKERRAQATATLMPQGEGAKRVHFLHDLVLRP